MRVVRERLFSAEKGLSTWVVVVIELREVAVGVIGTQVLRKPECLARTGVLLTRCDESGAIRLRAAPDFGLCMIGAQQEDRETQENGSLNTRPGGLHTL